MSSWPSAVEILEGDLGALAEAALDRSRGSRLSLASLIRT